MVCWNFTKRAVHSTSQAPQRKPKPTFPPPPKKRKKKEQDACIREGQGIEFAEMDLFFFLLSFILVIHESSSKCGGKIELKDGPRGQVFSLSCLTGHLYSFSWHLASSSSCIAHSSFLLMYTLGGRGND